MGLGAVKRTGTRRRDQYAKAYRKSMFRSGMDFSIRVHVDREPRGGHLFSSIACPATFTPTRIMAASRETQRCGYGRGGTPTAAAKAALRSMSAKLR